MQGAYRLVEMYREQCVTLETDLAQIREEGDMGREIFKVRSHESLRDMNNSDYTMCILLNYCLLYIVVCVCVFTPLCFAHLCV